MFRKVATLCQNRFVQVCAVSAYILLLFTFTVLRFTYSDHPMNLSGNYSDINENFDNNDGSSKPASLVTALPENVTDIRYRINKANQKQTILNKDIFGPLRNDSIVILVQVYDDKPFYLEHLIESLSKASEINNTLVIFSHAYYRTEINQLIKNITFCKVLQIFYPNSIQTHPNEFPGTQINDCPYWITLKEAVKLKCTNALYPDFYGHYRRPEMAQLKHQWWWQLNRVLDQLPATKDHNGFFVMLQENHYVAEDFIPVLRLMGEAQKVSCKNCNIYALGMQSLNVSDDTSEVIISYNISKLGLAFTHPTWQIIRNHSLEFCTHDDFNWDWSLTFISEYYLTPRLYSMIPSVPRVLPIKDCNSNSNGAICDPEENLAIIQQYLEQKKTQLYPKTIKLVTLTGQTYQLYKNGGYSDPRDQNLCLNMTQTLVVHKLEESLW